MFRSPVPPFSCSSLFSRSPVLLLLPVLPFSRPAALPPCRPPALPPCRPPALPPSCSPALPFPPFLRSSVLLFSFPRSPILVFRSSFSIPPSPFLLLRSPFSVPPTPFPILRSSFSVFRSPFPALSLPFPVSPLLELCCPFFVPCRSNILLLL